MLKDEFRRLINRFLEVSAMAPANFGVAALDDPSFVLRIRRGRECRENTRQRVLDWMAKYVAENNIEFDFNGWRG